MKNKIAILFLILTSILACKKDNLYEGKSDPNVIIHYRNQSAKMDSLQTISFITKQKISELYDLSLLNNEKKNDTTLDSIVKSQLQSYFIENDSITLPNLLKELDSLQVKYVSIYDVRQMAKDSTQLDTIGLTSYKVKYYNKDKRFFLEKNKMAKYILKKNPHKFKTEFKFYFSEIREKDSL